MFNFKSNKVTLPLYFCIVLALLTPVLAQAELGSSGGGASRDATAQREAKERKLEKKKKEAEAKKSAGVQQSQPATEQQPTEQPKEKPAGE